MELNNHRHFYLYAKGHYKTTETLTDLKVIQGHWSGVDPKYLMKRDVAHLMITIAYPHATKTEFAFREFMKYLDPNYMWAFPASVKEVRENYDYMTAVIHSCISVLQLTTVDEIDSDLGDPDPQILPISEARLKRLKEEAMDFDEKLLEKIGHVRQEDEYFLMEEGAEETDLFIKAMSNHGKLDAEMGQKLHAFLESGGIKHKFFHERCVIVNEQALNDVVLKKEN